jgi:N-methylhydantoinase A
MAYLIGVDVGGTFTDAAVVDKNGAITVGKAPTTPSDPSDGFFAALALAAGELGLSLEGMLQRTDRLAHGTTVGTNAVVTRGGARVGLMTTLGFSDTLKIMNNTGRATGVDVITRMHLPQSGLPAPFVQHDMTGGVRERIDYRGREIVALNEDDVRRVAAALVEAGAQAIAVAYLWSFNNNAHELRTREIIAEAHPGLPVSLSHEIAAKVGEYQRTATTALNAYVQPLMEEYTRRLEQRAQEHGYENGVLFMLCHGGLASGDRARLLAVQTLQSGPAGGVVGSAITASTMDRPNIITTDMGGTTMDVSVIAAGKPLSRSDTIVEQHELFLNMIDVESIGAGGGSIGWIHEHSGSLRVGPQSSGAEPGPACYGRGGTQPTITDADLLLGVLDPDAFLGGRVRLDRDAAETSMKPLADRLGLSIDECAAGMVRVANANMSDLIRRMTLQRGLDPRNFSVYAFGGGGGAHASLYARPLGIDEFIVPQSDAASVWSAMGVGVADLINVIERPLHLRAPFDASIVAQHFAELEAQTADAAKGEQGHVLGNELQRFASCKYGMQAFVVEAPVPDGKLDEAAMEEMVENFEAAYAQRYGKDAGYREAGVQLMQIAVRHRGTVRKPNFDGLGAAPPEPRKEASRGKRDVYWFELSQRVSTAIWDGTKLVNGNELDGPAVVEFPDTTIVVRPWDSLRIDQYGNAVVSIGHDTTIQHPERELVATERSR